MIKLGAFLFALQFTSVFCAETDKSRNGYVLKHGKAEYAAGALIMASPQTGSQNGVLMQEDFSEKFSTGLHYHTHADEFFYVLDGSGVVVLKNKEYKIGKGDVIFIPYGLDHKMFTQGQPMKVLVFLDKPGLEEEFRTWHIKYGDSPPESLEQLNAIAKKYGTVYKTLD